MRIALECGTHSPWISRLLQPWGHQVIVANARKIRAITASESKNDTFQTTRDSSFAKVHSTTRRSGDCDPGLGPRSRF